MAELLGGAPYAHPPPLALVCAKAKHISICDCLSATVFAAYNRKFPPNKRLVELQNCEQLQVSIAGEPWILDLNLKAGVLLFGTEHSSVAARSRQNDCLTNPPWTGDPVVDGNLRAFQDYFKNTWLPNREKLDLCNHWDTERTRTTNHAEGYHNEWA